MAKFGNVEVLSIDSSGTTAGFFNVTPATQPTAITLTYNTSGSTLDAYTTDAESSAYTGQDNTAVGTTFAKVADLNALRVAYETLRASHDSLLKVMVKLVTDLRSVGLSATP